MFEIAGGILLAWLLWSVGMVFFGMAQIAAIYIRSIFEARMNRKPTPEKKPKYARNWSEGDPNCF